MDRFFVWIGRVNSILFLLALIGAGLLAASIYMDHRERLERRQRANVAVAAETQSEEGPQRLTLGDAEVIAGTDALMVPLGLALPSGITTESVKLRSGPHYGREIRNVMFLAGDGRTVDWLFKSNGNFLRSLEQMKQWPYHDPDSPTIALYYEFSSVDTNRDNKLDRDDRFTVALGQPDEPNIREIIHNVDRVLSHKLIGGQTLAVIYVSGGNTNRLNS